MWGIKITFADLTNSFGNRRWFHSSTILTIAVSGRRLWAAFNLNFCTGKAWQGNMMIFGLHVVSYLESPNLIEAKADTRISDMDMISIRKWAWGFNYFQGTGKSENGISNS